MPTSGVLTGGTVGVGNGVGVAIGPRSTMLWIGAGRPVICAGVTVEPGATSTSTVRTWPVTSVTWTRCISADAVATSTTA